MASSGSEDREGEETPAPSEASTSSSSIKVPIRYCCVYDCLNNYKRNPELSFFGFPQNRQRVKLWVERIRRPDILQKNGFVSSYYRICEIHFEPRHINSNTQRRRLMRNAEPCLHLPHAGPYVNVIDENAPAASTVHVQRKTLVRSTLEVFQYTDNTTRPRTKKQQRKLKLLKPSKPITAPPAHKQFYEDCDRNLPPNMAEFVKLMTRLQQTGHAYNNICLKLLHSSPNTYRLLQSTLDLPTVGALHQQCAHLLHDFDTKLTDLLKTRVDRMTKKEKHCTISVEFIDVRPHVYYNITFDRIVGLHEMDSTQSPRPAVRTAVVTVRGLLVEWVQPVAICFLSLNDESLSPFTEKIIRRLFTIGLIVHGLVCDPMAPVIIPEVSPERPFFQVDDTKIYYIYDPPRLMKMLLCDFQAYGFHFENMIASWSDVLEYRKIEKHKSLTLTPGITDAQINPNNIQRMKPELTARVLSRTLAAALSSYVDQKLLPETTRATISLILKISNLYDFLNSNTMRSSALVRKGLTQNPVQIGFLMYMKKFFKYLKLEDSCGTDQNETKRLSDSWQITIGAVLALREKLEPVQPYLLTRCLHMSDKITESLQRAHKCKDKPTCRQVFNCFKKYFFTNMLKPSSAEKALNLNSLLAKVMSDAGGSSLDKEVGPIGQKVRATDYRGMLLPSVAAAAKHLLRAALRVHGDCERTRRYVAEPLTDDFIELVSRLDEALVSTLKQDDAPARALIGDLLLDVDVLDCELPCECFPLDYVKQFFLRMRLYRLLRHNQARFKNANASEEVDFEVNPLQ